MRVFIYPRRCLPKNRKPTRSKNSNHHPMLTDDDRSFLHFRSRSQIASRSIWLSTGSGNRGNPKGTGCSRGERPCLQGLVSYTFCGRGRGKGCRPAFGGIAYRAADSGRDRPAHRQIPTAVRKRTGRNLRAVISEKILFRPGRSLQIKAKNA